MVNRQQLADALGSGRWVGNRSLPAWEPNFEQQPTDPPAGLVIPAADLRAVLLDSSLTRDPHGLRLSGHVITGRLDLADVTVTHPLSFVYCRFTSPIDLTNAHLRSLVLDGSHLHAMDINGNSLFGHNLKIDKDLNAATRDVQAPFHAAGALLLSGANIGGRLDLAGAWLGVNRQGYSLFGDNLEIGSNLHATTENVDAPFQARGGLHLRGAHIGGQLNMLGARLGANHAGISLDADTLHIGGGLMAATVDPQAPFQAAGALQLRGAHIGGQFGLIGARLGANRAGNSLDAETLKVSDLLAASPDSPARLEAAGALQLHGAHIGGQLALAGAQLGANYLGNSLDADNLQVDSSLFASTRIPQEPFQADGALRLDGAHIGGQFDLTGARLGANHRGNSLDAENLQVDGPMRIYETNSEAKVEMKGRMLLTNLRVGHLTLGESPRPSDLQLHSVLGWSLGGMGGWLINNPKALDRWLADAEDPASQPFLEVANIYDRDGRPAEARWLRYRAAVHATGRAPRRYRPFRWIHSAVVGYGYYPLRTLPWLLLLLVVSAGLAYQAGATFTTPTTTIIRTEVSARQHVASSQVPGRVPNAWCNREWDTPCLQPITYALANTLPTLPPSGTNSWSPPPWATPIFLFLRLAGWTLTALFLAGITGLLRRT